MLECSEMLLRRIQTAASPFLLLSLLGALALAASGLPQTDDPDLVALRGRAFCVDAASGLESTADDCDQPGVSFAFRTEDGRHLEFMEEDPKAKMFIDPRVRRQPLQIEGWLREGERFELLSIYSIKDGALYHIHYRCDVCNITATAPGPCWCCGQEFDFREEPVKEGDDR